MLLTEHHQSGLFIFNCQDYSDITWSILSQDRRLLRDLLQIDISFEVDTGFGRLQHILMIQRATGVFTCVGLVQGTIAAVSILTTARMAVTAMRETWTPGAHVDHVKNLQSQEVEANANLYA